MLPESAGYESVGGNGISTFQYRATAFIERGRQAFSSVTTGSSSSSAMCMPRSCSN